MTRIYQLEVFIHKQERKSPEDHKLDELFVFKQKVFYVKCPSTLFRYYTEKHEWVDVNGSIGAVGVSKYV